MRKLYYEDCHLRQFTAAVTGCEKQDRGWLVTLDNTAFYPEGGGQACDLGTIDGVKVLDVREKGKTVLHLCDGALEIGKTVTGRIDWERRFDLMQQHTGEHILSGLINRKFGYHNVGFHIGGEGMEVDFDGPIDPEALAELEIRANEAVWADLPVKCWIPTPEELLNVKYRSKKTLSWPVRIVEVPGFDSCACCGVHVARTGEVGIIKILSCVKFHGGIRLEMVCGRRAYRYLTGVFEQNRQVSQTFSAKMLETGDAARKTANALSEEKFRRAELQMRVFDTVAMSYVNQKNVLRFEDGLEPGQVRMLADKIAGACHGFAAVFSGGSYCLAAREGDLRPLGRALNERLDGRGGGKPNFQQGSVQADQARIEEFFRELGVLG
ncbi:MAG: alanyl-tRNA editing protein [Oscillospiraceae bacterium]|nr:alanyl-tRNA editing protein [Oscillospiraceae bacterium]